MIRLASNNDIIKIIELGTILNDNFAKTYDLSNYLKNDNYIILVNEEEIINGFIIIYKNIDYFELESIAVDINYRKKGIASKLFDFFINKYTKNNDSILLEVASNNKAAINLYNKLGFEVISVRKKYYKHIDAYVMKKVI